MKANLLKGMTEQEIVRLKSSFAQAALFREVLIKHLSVREEPTLTKEQYETASWPYLAADEKGYQRAIRDVINLLKED